MKILIATVFLLLVMPSMAVEYAGDYMYNITMQSPDVGAARVNMDNSHIEVIITPGTYSHNAQKAACHIMSVGYYGVLHGMPDYNGYLRIIATAQNSKTAIVWEMGANEMRQAHEAGGSDGVANLIIDRVYNGSKSISYYWSDGYGDITKTVKDGSYGGKLSASAGNWLDDRG